MKWRERENKKLCKLIKCMLKWACRWCATMPTSEFDLNVYFDHDRIRETLSEWHFVWNCGTIRRILKNFENMNPKPKQVLKWKSCAWQCCEWSQNKIDDSSNSRNFYKFKYGQQMVHYSTRLDLSCMRSLLWYTECYRTYALCGQSSFFVYVHA